jgi:exopolyphosphatase/pppGpp-phosphohydrolase
LIIPGTAVVLATMELLGAQKLNVSVRGLRYGVLTAAIREEESGARSHARRSPAATGKL